MIRIVFFESGAPAAGRTVQARTGDTLMKAAVKAGLDGIAADCGGVLTCATCHVQVREPWSARLPPLSAAEDEMLGFTACSRGPRSRLACQIVLTADLDGIEVDLPASQY